MKIFLGGIEINKADITVNDGLNYGRFPDRETKIFELQLSRNEFIQAIEKEYEEIKNEIKRDDEMYHDTSDFSQTGYATLSELFDFENEFESIFMTYLDRPLFQKLFPSTPDCRFIINSTDSVLINEDTIRIKGRVFEKN